MKKILLLVVIILIALNANCCFAGYGDTSTWLSRIYAGDNGSPTRAYIDFAEDVLFKSNGTMVIADTYNNVIRQVNGSLSKIKTLAGTGSYGNQDGYVGRSKFAQPRGVAISGKTVLIADSWNHRIRKIVGNSVSTIVKSGLYFPEGVEIYGSTVYIADTGNGAIKKTSINGGNVSTLVKGQGLVNPKKLRADSSGRYLYVADAGAHKVFKVNSSNGHVELIAGSTEGYKNGIGAEAQFNHVDGVVIDEQQNCLFVTDGNGYTDYVRKIDLASRKVTEYAIDSDMITLNYPKGLAIKDNYIYVANSGISSIQRFNRYTGITKEKGDKAVGKKRFENEFGSSDNALSGRPTDIIKSKRFFFISENNLIRRIKRSNKRSKLLVGSVVDAYREGTGNQARFSSISAMVLDKNETYIYIADRWNNRIRKINIATKTSELVSGSGKVDCTGRCNGYQEGTKDTAKFSNPSGITISPDNKFLYVTDGANNRIRRVKISNGKTALIAGSGGTGYKDGYKTQAVFNRPYAITINKEGTKLYVADSYNNCIREIDIKTKRVTTLAGSNKRGYRDGYGRNAEFSTPNYVKYSNKDKKLYTTEAGTHKVRVIDPTNGLVKTITGTDRGYQNGNKFHTEFNNPSGVLPLKNKGYLLVADTWNDLIRKVDIKGRSQFYQPGPIVYGVGPDNRYPYSGNPSEVKWLYINGARFLEAPKAYFGNYQANKTMLNNSGRLTVIIPFGKMPRGTYNVKVVNIDGQEYTKANAFTIY